MSGESFPFVNENYLKHSKKTNPKIIILEILVDIIEPEIIHSCEHGFVIKLKRINILDFIISGCILYTKISRMVIFRLVFLLYFLKLTT